MIIAKTKKKARRMLEWCKLHAESFRDANRYFRAASWAGPVERHKLAHIESDLIKHYHVIEKGLAMPDFRPRAGVEVLRQLVRLVEDWQRNGGDATSFHFQAALSLLRSYHERNLQAGVEVSDLIPPGVFDLTRRHLSECSPVGGAMSASATWSGRPEDFDTLAFSRHSVRDFDAARVPARELVMDAVRVATTTPSVCNRRTWRVHVFQGEQAQSMLSHQNGNRGFGHLIPCVAVVTSDMRLFAGGAERYQGWIECGLFAMTFLLALHARGLGTVALNWSRSNKDDGLLREAARIPEYERIAMLIGVGYPAPGHLVTCSPCPPPEHFTTWH
jgi:nitroreductase